jgi:thioredoxin reductase
MSSKSFNWELEVDLVCAGSGLGGITAAIVTHDLGKKAVVLEKAPKLGVFPPIRAEMFFYRITTR